MKKTKILFSIILALSLLLLPMSVGAESTPADDPAEAEEAAKTGEGENGAAAADATDDPSNISADMNDTAGETDVTAGASYDDTADGEEKEGEVNPFEKALEELGGYATEIICTLSLIASLVLAYAYKKGLLPLLSATLSTVTKTLSGIKAKTEENENELGAELEKLSLLANAQEERLARWDGELKEACAALAEVTKECKDTAGVKWVLSAEVELLYDIFMSSSLPQYKKDAVAERIADMKRGLETDEKE